MDPLVAAYLKQRKEANDDDLLKKRINLNLYEGRFVSEHPFLRIIQNWKIPRKALSKIKSVRTNPHVVLVETKESLVRICKELMSCSVVALSSITEECLSYLGIITIILISTEKKDYVIDSVKLLKYIYDNLGTVLRDPNIVKIVSDGRELVCFQRDFRIFCVGVICLDELFRVQNASENSVLDLLSLVRLMFGNELSQFTKQESLLLRPLPWQSVLSAGERSYYLLRCWSQFKILIEDLQNIELVNSKKITLELYSFPNYNFEESWNRSLQSLSPIVRSIFSINSQKLLYEKLFDWRLTLAKKIDVNYKFLISDSCLGLLCRAKPSSGQNLDSLYPEHRLIQEHFWKKLFDIIGNHVEVHRISPPIKSKNYSTTLRRKRIKKNIQLINKIREQYKMDRIPFVRNLGPLEVRRRLERQRKYLLTKYS